MIPFHAMIRELFIIVAYQVSLCIWVTIVMPTASIYLTIKLYVSLSRKLPAILFGNSFIFHLIEKNHMF